MGVYAQYVKRPLDIFLSLLGIVILFPLALLLVMMYLLSFSFPILYRQQRTGKDERTFTLIKFRSLKSKGSDLAERRFLLGDFLRFTSLDELPQLLNVLGGDMSLIGPRPLPIEYLQLFSPEQRTRHHLRPGITGWAQVNGRHEISWQRKFELDQYYVRHISFLLDLRIVLMTIKILFSFRKDVSLSEEKFKGN